MFTLAHCITGYRLMLANMVKDKEMKFNVVGVENLIIAIPTLMHLACNK